MRRAMQLDRGYDIGAQGLATLNRPNHCSRKRKSRLPSEFCPIAESITIAQVAMPLVHVCHSVSSLCVASNRTNEPASRMSGRDGKLSNE